MLYFPAIHAFYESAQQTEWRAVHYEALYGTLLANHSFEAQIK